MKLFAATGNAHKLEEFRRILAPLGVEVFAPADAGCVLDVKETGATFAENAALKAQALYAATGMAAIADDSGLCIDALDGRPGVYSARYMGEETSYATKNNALLQELRTVAPEKRTARFVCSICCLLEDGTRMTYEGICEGSIATQPSGNGGFGYDPIFLYQGQSFADMPPQMKDAVSHRGQALRLLVETFAHYMKEKGKYL